MRKTLAWVLVLFTISGCATAKLPAGPDIYGLNKYSDVGAVAVSKVVDERGTISAGTIGATGVRVKNDVVPLTTNYLLSMMNTNLNLNVIPVGSLSSASAGEVLGQSDAGGGILLKIKSLKLHSVDAMMQPVEVDMDVDVAVFERGGKVVVEKSVSGHYEKRIGLSIVDKSTGELVDQVVRETIANVIKDSDIKLALETAAGK